MPFSFAGAAQSVADAGTQSRFLRKATTNPFYASIMVVIVVVLTVMVVFHDAIAEGKNFGGLLIRTGFYSFAGVLGVMYLHNYFTTESMTQASGGYVPPAISGDVAKLFRGADIEADTKPSNDDDDESPSVPTFL